MNNFACIGYGKMGKIRASTAIDLNQNFIAFFDPHVDDAMKVDSVDQIIGNSEIDNVFISTPNYKIIFI